MRTGPLAESIVIGRHDSPALDPQGLLGACLGHDLACGACPRWVRKDHRNPETVDPLGASLQLRRQQSAGQGQKQACPVACQFVGRHRTPVFHATKGLERGIHDGTRVTTLRVGHETDPAGVAFALVRMRASHIPIPTGSFRGTKKGALDSGAPLLTCACDGTVSCPAAGFNDVAPLARRRWFG